MSINVGVPGPPVRSRCQDPVLLEDVLIDFPDLVVIVAESGLGAINAVRLTAAPFERLAPVVVALNRHDDSDDVLVIRLDGPHHLYAEHNGTDYGDLDNGYTLGTAFTATMVASGIDGVRTAVLR